MQLLIAFSRIRNGAKGTWRSLKVGETIAEGELQYGLTFVCDVNEKHIGSLVTKSEAIIRLEFEK